MQSFLKSAWGHWSSVPASRPRDVCCFPGREKVACSMAQLSDLHWQHANHATRGTHMSVIGDRILPCAWVGCSQALLEEAELVLEAAELVLEAEAAWTGGQLKLSVLWMARNIAIVAQKLGRNVGTCTHQSSSGGRSGPLAQQGSAECLLCPCASPRTGHPASCAGCRPAALPRRGAPCFMSCPVQPRTPAGTAD